jgi:hypothetical protein
VSFDPDQDFVNFPAEETTIISPGLAIHVWLPKENSKSPRSGM